MRKGIIYCRVSSYEQLQGTSLESQQQACVAYAQRNDIEVVRLFVEEGESATAVNRTEFIKALEFCRTQRPRIEAFIVWKIDRFARNTTDHFAVKEKLRKFGAALHSVTEAISEDPVGKLTETVLAGFSQFENEVRIQRCMGGMEARLRDGIWCWQAPLGYLTSKRRGDRRKTSPDIADPERFSHIQRGLKLYAAGNHTITRLADESNGWGLRTRTGRPISRQLWERILSDKFYAGVLVNPMKRDEFPGGHQPMITQEEFDHIQTVKRRYSNNARNPRPTIHPDFPLRGFVRCECQKPLTAAWHRGRSKMYPAYHCHNRECQHHGRYIARAELEAKFAEWLHVLSLNPATFALLEQILSELWGHRGKIARDEATRRGKELAKVEQKLKMLLELRLNGEISPAEFTEQRSSLTSSLEALQRVPVEPTQEGVNPQSLLAKTKEFICDLPAAWLSLPPEGKQRLQRLVQTDGIIYHKSEKRIGTVIPGLIFNVESRILTDDAQLVAEVGQNLHQILLDLTRLADLAGEVKTEGVG